MKPSDRLLHNFKTRHLHSMECPNRSAWFTLERPLILTASSKPLTAGYPLTPLWPWERVETERSANPQKLCFTSILFPDPAQVPAVLGKKRLAMSFPTGHWATLRLMASTQQPLSWAWGQGNTGHFLGWMAPRHSTPGTAALWRWPGANLNEAPLCSWSQ